MPDFAAAGYVVPYSNASCGPGKTAAAGSVVPYTNASCEPGKTAVAFVGRAAERRLNVTGAAPLSRSHGSDVAAVCSCRNDELCRHGVRLSPQAGYCGALPQLCPSCQCGRCCGECVAAHDRSGVKNPESIAGACRSKSCRFARAHPILARCDGFAVDCAGACCRATRHSSCHRGRGFRGDLNHSVHFHGSDFHDSGSHDSDSHDSCTTGCW